MGPFRSVKAMSRLLAGFSILLLSAGSGAQPDAGTSPFSDELKTEIERLLKSEKESVAGEKEAVEVFDRIEELAQRLAEVGDFETAGALAKKGAEFFPEERRSLALLGWTEGLAGEYDRAIEVTRSALEAKTERLPDPQNSSVKKAETNLAGFLIHEGELQEAVTLLERAAEGSSDRGAIRYLLGQAYFELGDSFLAAKAYERALREAENLATAEDYFRYATALDQMGKLDRAAKALQRGVQKLPNASGLYLNLGLNAEATGATREAYLHYRMETEVSGPDSPFSVAADKRIERIEAVQSKSAFPDATLGSLIAYLQLREDKKNPENADKETDSKIEKAYTSAFANVWPEHPYLKLLQADRLVSTGAPDRAVEVLEKARAVFPNQVLFTLELAKIYGGVGDASKSNALIRDALLQAPEHWKAQRIVGPLGSPN